MVIVDCGELTDDEELALTSYITDELNGRAIALPKNRMIVLDIIGGGIVTVTEVQAMVQRFFTRRKDHGEYSTETKGDAIFVRSPDPIPALRRDLRERLPPNIKKCPFCSFVTPYEELYTVHVRSHGFL